MANNPATWPEPNYVDPELAGSLTGSLATSITLGVLTVIAVIVRFYARIAIVRRVGLDDIFIVLALVSDSRQVKREGFRVSDLLC